MNMPTIESLLKAREAWPNSVHGDKAVARANALLPQDGQMIFDRLVAHQIIGDLHTPQEA